MAAAAGAAAAAAERARQEEEEMTPYSKDDLDGGWEFKFLRSATAKFRDPVFLRATLDEESRAGWTVLEKFDDTRIRLKRPTTRRASDANAPFDPYRTWVGTKPGALAALIILGVLAAIGLMLAVIFTLVFLFSGPHGVR
jgi:hypothetical protein